MAQKVKIIAELGMNHDGSENTSRELIDNAIDANVDAVKFQYRDIDSSYSKLASREIGDEILIAEIKKNYLSPSSIINLTEYAKKRGLEVGISFFNKNDILNFQENINLFDFFKIPSAELTNLDLTNQLLSLGKHLFISTGAHFEEEIVSSLNNILTNDNWTPLHCVSNYPSKMENAKLGYINHLSMTLKRDVGYSSHDENWEICILAIALGARVVERHLTLDKNSKGLEHTTSSTSKEFKTLSEFASNFDMIMQGDYPRVPNQGELLNRQNLGRSYFFNKDLELGEKLLPTHLDYRSPFIGLSNQDINKYYNKNITQSVKSGDPATSSLFDKKLILNEHIVEFANDKKFSLPVRCHDYDLLGNLFPISQFELHLSFQEAQAIEDINWLNESHHFSIHLPDYISSTDLIDPFFSKEEQKNKSLRLIEKVALLASEIQEKSGKQVPIVGSFSNVGENKSEFYGKLKELTYEYDLRGVYIYPQWLPPIGWYFGGSVKLESMNAEKDADFIKKYQIPICMDFCHLFMGGAYHRFSVQELLDKLEPLIKHIHIADALGFDGEGVQFGKGDEGNMSILENYIDYSYLKVIEVWQGHLNQGRGFREALCKLEELYGKPN